MNFVFLSAVPFPSFLFFFSFLLYVAYFLNPNIFYYFCSSQRALQQRPAVTLSEICQHFFKSEGRLYRYLYPPWSPTPGLMIDYCPLKDTHFFLIELLQQKLLVVNKIVKLLNYPAVNNSIVEGDNSIISIIKYSSYSIIRKILMTLDFNRKIYCSRQHRGTTQSRSYS